MMSRLLLLLLRTVDVVLMVAILRLTVIGIALCKRASNSGKHQQESGRVATDESRVAYTTIMLHNCSPLQPPFPCWPWDGCRVQVEANQTTKERKEDWGTSECDRDQFESILAIRLINTGMWSESSIGSTHRYVLRSVQLVLTRLSLPQQNQVCFHSRGCGMRSSQFHFRNASQLDLVL
eukprot:scpid61753/ scgid29425/ 